MPADQHTQTLSEETASPDAARFHAEPPGRLKKRAEFLRVASKGRKAPMPGLVLQALPRQDTLPVRLGFTVTKKVGNAVVRNRTRRRLKEAARLLLREHPVTGVDLVLIGRDGTRARPFPTLREDLVKALKRAGVT
jgi:ribonuclease P protein component